jgi:hypothetical protein
LQNRSNSLDFEYRARQDGGSEFSIEMGAMPAVHGFTLIASSLCMASFAARCRREWHNTGALHPVLWILAAAIAFQYGAQVLQMGHLWRYQNDGVGCGTMDALSSHFFMVSQVIHTTLLIAIARGYTLLRLKVDDCELLKSVGVVAMLAHSSLVGLRALRDDTAYRHHEHEGAIGLGILALRLLLFAWFLKSSQTCQAAGGFRLHKFLREFRLAGSVYFLAYPTLLLVLQVFAPYLRHPILHVGLLTMQLASSAWLASMFLSRGTYFQVSALGAPMLPRGGGAVCVAFGKGE